MGRQFNIFGSATLRIQLPFITIISDTTSDDYYHQISFIDKARRSAAPSEVRISVGVL